MRRTARPVILAALVMALAMPALGTGTSAEEVFEGTIVCAKCTLKRADAKECQDVLMVPDVEGAKKEYYITKNEVAKASGEACTAAVKARVTGTVEEKDGRTWLTASKIQKEQGAQPTHPH